MRMTFQQVDELEAAALAGDRRAVKELAAAARDGAADEQLYRIETPDGLVRVVNVRQYLNLTATDLARTKITMVRA